MTFNRKLLALVITLVLGFQFVVPFASPAFAQDLRKRQDREPLGQQVPATDEPAKQQEREVPYGGIIQGREDFTPAERQAIDNFAQQVAQALSLNSNGTIGLNLRKMGRLSSDQTEVLNRFVADINERRIGIAIDRGDGTVVVYGNPKAAMTDGQNDLGSPKATSGTTVQSNNSVWLNSSGVHIYVDPYWTALLADLQSWAIGTIAGLVATALCSTGVGCIAVGVAVSFVWWVVWQIIRRYYPTSLTINAPWWGWVTVQVWSSRSWLNGVTFRANLWT